MSLRIRIKFFKEYLRLEPSAFFKSALKKKLLNHFDAFYGAASKPLSRWNWYYRFAIVTVVAVVFVVGSIGTGAYAYESPEVTEGTPLLYPVKMALEKVEEKIQWTPEAKAKYLLKKIKRREAEQKVLEKLGKSAIKAELDIAFAEERLEDVEKKLEKIKMKNPILKEMVREKLKNRKEKAKNKGEVLKEK